MRSNLFASKKMIMCGHDSCDEFKVNSDQKIRLGPNFIKLILQGTLSYYFNSEEWKNSFGEM